MPAVTTKFLDNDKLDLKTFKINIEEQKSLPKPKKWPKVDTTKGEFVPPIPQEQKNEKTPEEKAKEEESENLLTNIEEMITKPMPKPPIV